jgi:hypothetical protein
MHVLTSLYNIPTQKTDIDIFVAMRTANTNNSDFPVVINASEASRFCKFAFA